MKKTIFLCAAQLLLALTGLAQTNSNLGTSAGNAGSDNTCIGYAAGDVVTGASNTFLGSQAGLRNTSGPNNTFLGFASGFSTTTGFQNLFSGGTSGYYNTTGSNNVYLGEESGKINSTGERNTFVGQASGYSNTASDNIFLGCLSGRNLTTGTQNTFLGGSTGLNTLTGSGNVFIGYTAGYDETGSNKLYIDNSVTKTPLIYGDFSLNQVGINALPNTTHALTVGGTVYSTGNIYATGIYVNGNSITDAGFEFWNKVGTNIWNRSDNVGIGVDLSKNPNNYRLGVKGKIGAQEVQIENNSLTWSDFVFKDDYKLISLEELEHYIKVNKHLPEIPTEAEVRKDGLLVSEMNAKLLQKVEELTLYVIELKKEVEALKAKK